MPAAADLRELHLCVISTLPMNHEAYGLSFRRDDDLLQRDPKEAFLVLRRTAWVVPESGKIPREAHQLPFLNIREWTLTAFLQGRELSFKLRLRGQRMVPTALKLRRNEPIHRVHGIVLAPGACYLIARMLQRQGFLLNPFVARTLHRLDRLDSRFGAEWRQALQQLLRHQAIGAESAEHHATRMIAIEEIPRTLIANHAGARVLS
jgi:hypothetical protein